MSQVATDYTTKELMAAFVASEIKDEETVSVGASLPVCRAGLDSVIGVVRPGVLS